MSWSFDLCIWRFDSCILGALEHGVYDVVGECPKVYVDVCVRCDLWVVLFYYCDFVV